MMSLYLICKISHKFVINESICSIAISGCIVIPKDFEWRSNQIKVVDLKKYVTL